MQNSESSSPFFFDNLNLSANTDISLNIKQPDTQNFYHNVDEELKLKFGKIPKKLYELF